MPSDLPSGGTIPVSRTKPALNLTELFNGFQPLFQALTPTEVNQLSMNIVKVLQGEGGTVGSLMSNTASLTNALADRDELIGRVIDNLSAMLKTVRRVDRPLHRPGGRPHDGRRCDQQLAAPRRIGRCHHARERSDHGRELG